MKVWRVPDGGLIHNLKAGSLPSYWADFFNDGKGIISFNNDGKVALWDAVTGSSLTDAINLGRDVTRGCMDPLQKRFGIGSGSRFYTFEPFLPQSTAPLWVAELAEALAGYRIAEDGSIKKVTTEDFIRLRKRLAALADNSEWSELASRFAWNAVN